jgi:hypothetical protein
MKNRLKILRRRAKLEPAGPGNKAGSLPPERQCDRDREVRSSLPLAFRIADLFGLAIEEIFQRS